MAGPFSNANTAVEIPGVQVTAKSAIAPVHQPQGTSAVQDAANLLGAIAQPVNALMGENYRKDMETQLKSVEMALAASRRPWSIDTLMSDEAEKDPIVKGAVAELRTMGTAVRRGQMPTDYAVDRMESIISSAVAKVPAYEQELRGAARNYLGFDPHTKMVSDMMQPTPQEQAEQIDTREAAQLGLDVNTYRQIKTQMFMVEFQKKNIDLQMAQLNLAEKPVQAQRDAMRFGWESRNQAYQETQRLETQTSNLIMQKTRLEASTQIMLLNQQLQSLVKQGGIKDTTELEMKIGQQFDALQAQALSQLPANANPEQIISYIGQQKTGAINYAKAVASGKLIATQNSYLKDLATNRLYNQDIIGPLAAVVGEQGLPQVMAVMGRISAGGEGALDTFLTSGTQEAGGLMLGGLLSYGSKKQMIDNAAVNAGNYVWGNGTTPNDEVSRKMAMMFGAESLTTPGQKGNDYKTAIEKLSGIAKSGDEMLVALSQPAAVANNSNNKETHDILINTFNSEAEAVKQKYIQLVRSGQIPAGTITLSNGQVVLPNNMGAQQQAAAPIGSPAYLQQQPLQQPYPSVSSTAAAGYSTEAALLMKSINRLLKYADSYKDTGVFPSTVYSGRENFIRGLLQADAELKAAQEAEAKRAASTPQQQVATGVIKYQYVDGKLTRVQQ